MVKYVSESSQGCTNGGRKVLPCEGGMNVVTFEALTCMFTLGLLIVAILTSYQDK